MSSVYQWSLSNGNLKIVAQSLLETLTKRRSQTFYRPIDLHSVKNAVGEDILK